MLWDCCLISSCLLTSRKLANPTRTGFHAVFPLCWIQVCRASPVYRATSLYMVPPVVIHTSATKTSNWLLDFCRKKMDTAMTCCTLNIFTQWRSNGVTEPAEGPPKPPVGGLTYAQGRSGPHVTYGKFVGACRHADVLWRYDGCCSVRWRVKKVARKLRGQLL